MKEITVKNRNCGSYGYFWRNDPDLKKVTILNPEDFKKPDFISDSDLVQGGLCDHKEIIHRNKMMTFLFDNPKLREKISKWSDINRSISSLPKSENNFLAYYEKKNPHWQLIEEIIVDLEKRKKDLPLRIETFLNELKDYRKKLFLPEKDMAERVKAKLNQTTQMDGVIEFKDFRCKFENSTIIGQKAFQAAWSPNYSAHIPSFLRKWKIFSFFGITKLAQRIADYNAKVSAKKSAIILNFPNSLIIDIEKGLKEILYTGKKTTSEAPLMKFLALKKQHFNFGIQFSYGESGLFIKPIYVNKSENNDEIPLHFSKYSAWNHNKKKPIVRAIEKAKIDFNKTIGLQKAQEVIDFINKYSKLQFGVNYGIDSPATNRDFRWNFLSNIYSSDENVEIYIKLRNERAWFFSRLEEILELCNKISNFQSVALRNNLPLCMPKIKNSGTGVTFLALAPIDMMNQGKKMFPFSFPSINGRMICLTGRHGRGKSVAGNSILQSLWLAQSGLPVFAESFEFDIKDVIGAIVNDEGEGSTATIFLQKAKNLLKNIQKVPVEKSLIFIDEIGKGTQEDAGMKLGVRLLKTISKNGYSAVFNTQIMDLANFAKNDLDAICLKVENNHQFSPGIGEGGMEDLIKEIGLDKYLS